MSGVSVVGVVFGVVVFGVVVFGVVVFGVVVAVMIMVDNRSGRSALQVLPGENRSGVIGLPQI